MALTEYKNISKSDALTDLDMSAIDEPARFIPELQEMTSYSLEQQV